MQTLAARNLADIVSTLKVDLSIKVFLKVHLKVYLKVYLYLKFATLKANKADTTRGNLTLQTQLCCSSASHSIIEQHWKGLKAVRIHITNIKIESTYESTYQILKLNPHTNPHTKY